ncbi:50S ribosomal protein L39e [Candidatus Woesearchaeota archaeon]|nr:50S ribosomal protein L39e [Candidatus Woesearchaeota archaeon]
MARFKNLAKKLRMAKRKAQTRWAPIWIIPKIYSKGRRVHPSKHTHVKRNWKTRGARIKV